jgi:EAL domain-containing protein (putative c-di-GMP-specific phosphodiesterase class I)
MGRVDARVREMRFALLPEFEIAFQPIVDVRAQRVIAYEALTRGRGGRTFPELVAEMDGGTARRFHRHTASESICRAKELGLFGSDAALCINMQPDLSENAVTGEFILEVARKNEVPPAQILLELTEDHRLTLADLRQLVAQIHSAGFVTGMDDFGAGYSGLTMLVECLPEVLKLDRALIHGIDQCEIRTKVVAGFAQISRSLDIMLVAEGVETVEECEKLQELGVEIMQGFLFSHPIVNALPVWDGMQFAQRTVARRVPISNPSTFWKTRRSVEPITLQAECA